LTLSPALAALLLQPRSAKRDWFTRVLDVTLGWLFRLFNRGLTALTAGYARSLHYVVRLAVIALVVYAGLIYLTYLGFQRVPTGFIPQQDQGYLIVALQLPDAAALDRTDRVINRLADIARQQPGVFHTIAVPGFNL